MLKDILVLMVVTSENVKGPVIWLGHYRLELFPTGFRKRARSHSHSCIEWFEFLLAVSQCHKGKEDVLTTKVE